MPSASSARVGSGPSAERTSPGSGAAHTSGVAGARHLPGPHGGAPPVGSGSGAVPHPRRLHGRLALDSRARGSPQGVDHDALCLAALSRPAMDPGPAPRRCCALERARRPPGARGPCGAPGNIALGAGTDGVEVSSAGYPPQRRVLKACATEAESRAVAPVRRG